VSLVVDGATGIGTGAAVSLTEDRKHRSVPAARLVLSPDDRAEILALVDESLRSGSLTLGPRTAAFEDDFRARHDAPFAIAVSSGTAALEIIFRYLDVRDRAVVVPTNTFFATAAAVVHAGGIPRFADVSPDTLALTEATVEAALTERTAGVVLVHIAGLVTPEVEAIRTLCRRRGLFLVEDAAHAHGAAYDGRPAGSFGAAAAFSFYPTKVVTSGEGGVIVTGDERLHDGALVYRDQGKSGFLGGDHVRMGYAWRMSELHAAVGLVQLRRLDEFIAARRRVANLYDEGLSDLPGMMPLRPPPGCDTNYYKYLALLDHAVDRGPLKQQLRDEFGVSLSGEVYAVPLHRQPVFEPWAHGALPVAEDVCARHICLPIHSDMDADEAGYVIGSIRAVMQRIH
jgi:dTDP-4-amino-4,6-dideoxygalactose transaminase